MKKQIITILTLAIGIAFLSSCEKHELNEPGKLVPLTVDEDPALPSISVNGTLLHSEAFGNPSNDLIIAIHGGPGGDYRSLLNIKDIVDDGYYVVFYDQRGSGLSRRHDKDVYNTQIFIDDLDAVIRYYKKYDHQRVILFGHSWGAMIAAAHADQHPDETNGLILAEPGGLTWEQTEDYLSRSNKPDFFSESINDYVYLDQFITGEKHNELDYKAAVRLATEVAEGNNLGNPGPYPSWRHGAVCSSACIAYVQDHPFDFTRSLASYNTKVLFAYSQLNGAYGREHAESVASPFRDVQFTEVLGAGHECIYYGWNSLYPVVQDYLNDISNQ